jgi:tripeptide aminopeptidase
MNAERLLTTFLELVRIDSPSLREADVAAYCKKALEDAGCTVRFDESTEQTGSTTGNLIACLPAFPGQAAGAEAVDAKAAGAEAATGQAAGAEAPPILYFSAHMDTVVPGEGIEPVITDGIITSAGPTVLGGDDKVGVAAIIELVRTLAEAEATEAVPHPAVGVLLSVGEEIGLLGAHALDVSGLNAGACLVLDANGAPGTVIRGAPFHCIFTATFTGRAAHAGIEPEKGISAIALASKAVLAMELGRLDETTTANVGTISGGDSFNIVPGSCTVIGEFRAVDAQRAAEVKEQLSSAIFGAVADGEGSVDVKWTEEYRGFVIDEDDLLVQFVLDHARALDLPTRTVISGGGSDANVFMEKGLDSLVLGTGMTDVHGPDESLAVVDMEELTRLCIALAYAYEGA